MPNISMMYSSVHNMKMFGLTRTVRYDSYLESINHISQLDKDQSIAHVECNQHS